MKRQPAVRALSLATVAVMAATLAACGGGGGGGGGGSEASKYTKGPIKIWYSNNEAEVAWGKKMVKAWNADNPDEKISAQEIPAGKTSEEVIGAAITAGTAPCLVLNTSPAAVPQFQKMGGLVALDSFPDGKKYIEDRTGSKLADQYKSSDGKFYQLPWKSNPVVLFYNKDLFKKAGLNPDKPSLGTEDEFLATSRKLVKSGAAPYAIWPSPASDFFQSWFDFYPFYAAASGGKQLVENGKATFDDATGKTVTKMWATLYKEKLASKETYQGDSFAEGKAAMASAGPWAIAFYGNKVNWGAVPIPGTTAGSQPYTFSDAKNIAIYSACKNKATAWDVLKFATSKDQDGKFLTETGQMPMRHDLTSTYAEYFKKNPAYQQFAKLSEHTVEVPNVNNSVEVWQTFRNAWVKSVIFGNQDVGTALDGAATKINSLVGQ